MRIVAGYLGGRLLESPRNNSTHPMSEKMRGALFNALGDIKGQTVFDPFAGTGACSIEAISRGALSALLIEANTDSFKTIMVNARALGVDDKLIAKRGNCAGWSSNNKDKVFDLVIADPPYKPKDLDLHLAFKLSKHVVDGGLFVLSAPVSQQETVTLRSKKHPELTLLSYKKYGDGSLYFYRKTQ